MAYAIERETLVFDKKFKQINFKEKDLEQYVTIDFNDNQLEIVSPTFDQMESCYTFLSRQLHTGSFKNKIMWPYSYVGNYDIKISIEGKEEEYQRTYRKHLMQNYNNDLLLTCGIHINYNNDNETGEDYYFDLLKKIYAFSPLLVYLFGYTPISKDIEVYENALSLRNSYEHGYRNENTLNLNFNSLSDYRNSIDLNIKNEIIQNEKEVYSLVKLKPSIHKVQYLELRMLDLFPENEIGIDKQSLLFLEKLLNYLDTIELTDFNYNRILEDVEYICLHGSDKKININGKLLYLEEHLKHYSKLFNMKLKKKYIQYDKDYLNNLEQELKNHNSYTKTQFELSTQILIDKALEYNLDVEIINESKNLIKINNEYIRQATKTSADSYISIELASDKELTKQLLASNNINVPKSYQMNDENMFENTKRLVIKPSDTNFGLGITITENKQELLDNAIKHAKKYSDDIIIEEFIKGEEYRFLIIDDQVISVVYRSPANIIGDGIQNVEELVLEKNSDPRRGANYSYPLINIKIPDNVDPFYIPKFDEKIYLVETSNISTGGDSIEVSHMISEYYKAQALRAAKALNMKICGVDMIIEDVSELEGKYSIIEVNFNPAIHIHKYTFGGKGIDAAPYILKLLKLID